MLRRYFFYLMLGPVSNFLWAFWALPEIGEQGTAAETVQWLCTQAGFPALFLILLALRFKLVFWMLLVYAGFNILFAVGILGWSLMGPGTPLSIYAVSGLLLIMGFGVLYRAMQDLNWGKEVKRYDVEDERD